MEINKHVQSTVYKLIASSSSVLSVIIVSVMLTATAIVVMILVSAIVISDINPLSTVLDFVNIVSHLAAVASSSVLTIFAKAPIHFNTNRLTIQSQTSDVIHGKLSSFVRMESTGEYDSGFCT